MNIFLRNLFHYFLWITVSLSLCLAQNEPCEIGGESGTCVPLSECSQYVTLLKNPASTNEGLRITRARQCGFDGFDSKVCCPALPTTDLIRTNDNNDDFVDELPKPDDCGRVFINSAPYVFNGKKVKYREMVKWMALLGYKDSAVFWQCGGSIITSRHILTAAHCIKRNLYIVRIGELDLADKKKDESPVDFLVKRVIPHEQYTKFHNDIAIVVLDGTIDFKKLTYVGPICLPVPNYGLEFTDQKSIFVAGWGETENRGERPTELLYAPLQLLDRAVCASAYSARNVSIDERVLCAGDKDGEHDACNGDSGGPLVNKYYISSPMIGLYQYQLGVVSYGFKCSARRFAGVYTNVAYFVPWIQEKVVGKTARSKF